MKIFLLPKLIQKFVQPLKNNPIYQSTTIAENKHHSVNYKKDLKLTRIKKDRAIVFQNNLAFSPQDLHTLKNDHYKHPSMAFYQNHYP